MSRLSAGLTDTSGNAQAAISNPAAATAVALTVTYTTDAPAITPNSAYVVADGDATPTATERNELAEEVELFTTAALVDIAALRTTLTSVLTALRAAGVIQS